MSTQSVRGEEIMERTKEIRREQEKREGDAKKKENRPQAIRLY